MPESVSPAFVRVNYHSAFGLHVAEIPTQLWVDSPSPTGYGSFLTWNSGNIDADVMVKALVTAMADLMPTTSQYDNYVIYTQASPSAIPVPRVGNTLAIAGTNASSSWTKAVQITQIWRTTSFGLFKLNLLDAISGNNFDKTSSLPGSGFLPVIDGIVTDMDNGWMGRDNSRPASFLSQTVDLNDKLRRLYRMG